MTIARQVGLLFLHTFSLSCRCFRFGLTVFAVAVLVAGLSESAIAQESSLEQNLHTALKSANPDYKGGGTFRFKDSKLISINLMRCKGVTDLSPLSRFPLSAVSSVILYNATGITDIAPLRECRLQSLNLERCGRITDLSPLKGMPLRSFRMYACAGIEDLAPLKDMPLRHLDIGLNPHVRDISMLKGMPLHDLRIDNCPELTDISVLDGLPLELLSIFGSTGIKDYSALRGLKLTTLYFDPTLLATSDLQALRQMKTLQKIGTSWADYRKELSPKEFWQRFDAGEFRKQVAP